VPLVCIVLIFFLQFFSWVGIYPGGVPLVSQNAWQAAFGLTPAPDKDLKDTFPISKEKETEPGVSLLLLFYLVPFFLVTLVVSVGVAVLPYVKVQLPPQVQQLLPWKWAIITGLNAILLLFLGLQVVLNFSLETVFNRYVNEQPEFKKSAETTKDEKLLEVKKGQLLTWPQRTIWLRLTVWLHILSTLAAAYVYCMEKRGPGKPLPRLELQW